jgi:hypothetical protein
MNDGMGPVYGGDAGYGGGAGYAGFDPGTALFIGGIVVGSGLLIACLINWCQSKRSSP